MDYALRADASIFDGKEYKKCYFKNQLSDFPLDKPHKNKRITLLDGIMSVLI